MKKNYAIILIFIFVLCLVLCACDSSELSPWGEKNLQNDTNYAPQISKFRVYVYGAVENEGYYVVEDGATYLDAIVQAGRLDCSLLTPIANSVIDKLQLSILVPYVEDDVQRDCYNANSVFFSLRDPARFDGLSQAVINKIADYLENHGKIVNKTVLLKVLGKEDYANYHYKLFIAEADYEEAD